MNNVKIPYLLLSKDISWQKDVIATLLQICDKMEHPNGILEVQKLIFSLWIPLFTNFPKEIKENSRPNRQLAIVKKMVSYIQNHYKERITLDMIADSGNVCRSNCSALFVKYLSKSPICYVTEYRLNKSLALLLHSDLSITEISYEVGFHNSSYYSETFRKFYRCTPKEYIKKNILLDK